MKMKNPVAIGTACSICSAEADGLHYGAVSCRSCNAFFRRAVTFRQVYACRKDNNCNVSQDVRCACRACRFAKCLKSGMKITAVQPRRDPTGSQKQRRAPRRKGLSTLNGGPLSNNSTVSAIATEELLSPCLSIKTEPCSLNDTDEQQPCTSLISQYNNHEDEDELLLTDEGEEFDRLVQSYQDHQRLMQLSCTPVEDFLKEPEMGIKLREMVPTDVEKLSKVELSGLLFWIEKMHPYKLLAPADRTSLLKRYSVRKLSLDHFYHASKQREMIRSGNFVMLNNTFVPPGSTGFEAVTDDARTRAAKQEIFLPTFERFWRCVLRPFVNMAITDAEITALHMMLLWSSQNNSYVEEGTKEIMKKRREWAVNQLFEHYESIGQEDPAIRLGEVLLLLPEIEIICDKHCEDFQVAKLFNVCNMNEYWYEKICYSQNNGKYDHNSVAL